MTSEHPVHWWIGPPAPRGTAWLARACYLTILILVGHWVHSYLDGVALSPVPTTEGANDTGRLFNWHPILMTLGFVVLMSEGLLSYAAPVVPGVAREVRKKLHWGLHCGAMLCLALGLVAVWRSHELKLPDPMPDLYSPHSFLGLGAVAMLGLQALLGCYAYLWPRLGLPQRQALGPLHRFAGAATWVAGLAAVATGLQEKVTFLQMGKGLKAPAVFGPIIRLPAVCLPLLVVLGAVVLYLQVPAAASSKPVASLALSADGASTQGLLHGGAPAVADDEEEGSRGRF